MKKGLLTIIAVLFFILNIFAQKHAVKSPDGNLEIACFTVGQLSFSVTYKGKTAILDSKIRMVVNGDKILGEKPELKNETSDSYKGKIKSIVANKNAEIVDEYNWLKLEFEGDFGLELRAYNDGVAYRFFTSFDGPLTVESERLALRFPTETLSYFPEEESFMSHYERLYKVDKLTTVSDSSFCSLPVLVQTKDSINVLATEADLYDYASMFFKGTNGNTLKARFPKYVQETRPHKKYADRNEIITKEAEFIAKTNGSRTFPMARFYHK